MSALEGHAFPVTLHGLPVIAAVHLPEQVGILPGCLVVLQRSEDWVVSEHSYGRKGWGQGYYFTKRENAFAYLIERIERYYSKK